MPVTLSEAAAKEIKDIIKQQELPEDKTALRVGVKGGGCSGFSYMLDLTEEPAGEMDEMLESHGVKILCDMKSYLYLNGVEIDFISKKKNEPQWMLDWRLRAYRAWLEMEEPHAWPMIKYPAIDYQAACYYSAPKPKKKSMDEVDPELLATYEKLGIPLAERAALA